ncbi:MAG: phosphate ABC transporter substrate-binding protein PstS family protein [Alphaproteobacteria bacterium]|nr:phosphate ABC transporter substrate-binding protein PstS family protein [Alphaproteobacteria bacterium]
MGPRNALRAGLAAVLIAALAACGGDGGGGPSNVRVDGSSTVFPLSEAAAEAFMAEDQGRAPVTVGESGTGGGFGKFCRGETDVQGASRPILDTEMQACADAGITYVEAPIAFDGITILVRPDNPVSSITMAELRRIWEPAAQGTVMRWNQVNPAWPDLPLQLFGADTASGTFDYFTEAVNGTAKASRTDYTPSVDDNLTVQGVIANSGGLGYFGIAYFEQNRERLKALAVDAGQGPVEPTGATVASAEYPLSRPMFIYVNAASLERDEVQRFVQSYLANGGRLAQQVGYVQLPAIAYQTYAQRMRDRTTGTAFGGHQDVGASIDDVLRRELVSTAAPQPAAEAAKD